MYNQRKSVASPNNLSHLLIINDDVNAKGGFFFLTHDHPPIPAATPFLEAI